jgi:hypothetical protein
MGCLRPNAVTEVGFNAKSQSIRSSHSPLPKRVFLTHAIRPGGVHSRRIDAQAQLPQFMATRGTDPQKSSRPIAKIKLWC